MHNGRFRLMTAVAGAAMCLFAATSYGQNTQTTTGTTTTDPASAQTTAAPTNPGTQAGTQTTTPDAGAVTTPIDNTAPVVDNTTTDNGRRGFPWGLLGLLGLLGLAKKGDREVVRRDTYVAPATTGRTTTGVGSGDRMDLNSRAASGTGGAGSGSGSSGTSGMGDPGARR